MLRGAVKGESENKKRLLPRRLEQCVLRSCIVFNLSLLLLVFDLLLYPFSVAVISVVFLALVSISVNCLMPLLFDLERPA